MQSTDTKIVKNVVCGSDYLSGIDLESSNIPVPCTFNAKEQNPYKYLAALLCESHGLNFNHIDMYEVIGGINCP